MKKVCLLLVLFLLLQSTVFAEADTQQKSLTYTVRELTFTIPSGFEETSVTESELLFTVSSGAQMHVAILDGEGMDLEAAGQMLKYVIPVKGVETELSSVKGLPYVRCSFSDDSSSVYGMAALFLDEAAEDVYILFYISQEHVSLMEKVKWSGILNSVRAPKIYQQALINATPEPTPEPTSEPTTDFDFNAINRNPDKYNGVHFTISGRVLQIIEKEAGEIGTLIGARIATRGRSDDVIYITYVRQSGEDRLLEDDLVTFKAESCGLYTYTSVDNVPITLPWFFLEEIITIK